MNNNLKKLKALIFLVFITNQTSSFFISSLLRKIQLNHTFEVPSKKDKNSEEINWLLKTKNINPEYYIKRKKLDELLIDKINAHF